MRTVLLICLSVALLFALACGTRSTSGIGIDAAFQKLVAPDTKLLAGVDFERLKASPFYKRHEKDLDIPVVNAAAERIGVDPLHDVSYLVASWNGKNWLFMERGRFNASVVQKKLIAAGARSTTYNGRALLGDNGVSLAFFKAVAVEGTQASVREAIDVENGHTGQVPEELQDKLRTIANRDQIWVVSRGGLAFADMPMNPDLESALSNITGSVGSSTAGLYLDTGVHLSIEIQCISDKSATRVNDAVRGIIGFGRLSTKDNQEDLLRAYDSIQVNKKDQVVEVTADLTGELADKLLGSVRAFSPVR